MLSEFPNIMNETPTKPDSVPNISLKLIDNNLNNQTINNVKTGTLETIRTKIQESIFGETKNSTYNVITKAKIPAIIKKIDFLSVNLKI